MIGYIFTGGYHGHISTRQIQRLLNEIWAPGDEFGKMPQRKRITLHSFSRWTPEFHGYLPGNSC